MLPNWEQLISDGFAAFAPDYFDLFAPAFVEGQERPVDAGGEVAEDGFGGGVDAQGGGDEVKAGSIGRKAETGEVTVALELAEAEGGAGCRVGGLEVVPADADPVVEALQREVEVVVGFEFDDGEAAGLRAGGAGDGEQVEHAAVGGGGGGGLGVEGWEVGAEDGFEPALGGHAVERVALVPGSATAFEKAGGEFAEGGGVFF